ncbi:MAG: putative DNA binding domain-containing protein [Lachnospiraceae bacterium]|nr:putative DNA binding domain-containing protein [Lachnospiraceae bacterium]
MFREDETNEFKKTTGEINEAMVSISSILNKHGHGKIFFGLKNDGTPNKFTIVDSTLRDVSRKIFESIRPQIYPEVKREFVDNVEIIVVNFKGKDKPYSAFGKYYIRVADEDREMSPGELRKMMIAQEYEENWENKSSGEAINDVNQSTLNNFYKNATNCGRLPELGTDADILMHKLGLLNGEYLTNAGKMLFSKNHPITLKMAVFATEHKNTFLDISRVEGNIFELINEATSYIIKNIRWSSRISDDGIHRIETPEIPIDAIREAVINSFAHARYDSSVQHEIDIYSNRISIMNPGSFANDFRPEDFATRDLHSFLRNELISKTLYLCKDVETFGSGLRKIYTLCRDSDVKVSYINSENDFTIEFSRTDRNIMSEDGMINGMINGTISDLESEILEILRKDEGITVPEMAEICKKSSRTISRAIAALKSKKLIERIGSNKAGSWKVK